MELEEYISACNEGRDIPTRTVQAGLSRPDAIRLLRPATPEADLPGAARHS